MKLHAILRACAAVVALAALASCVTINIYFPAAAAEKAADKIIDEVWQLQKQISPGKPAGQPSAPPTPQQ